MSGGAMSVQMMQTMAFMLAAQGRGIRGGRGRGGKPFDPSSRQ